MTAEESQQPAVNSSEARLPFGLYFIPYRMDITAYHADPAVSKSHLDQIARSPLHYWSRYVDPNREPVEPTPAMRLGSALHCLVLEPELFDAQFITAPAMDRRTKAGKEAWEQFSAEAGSRTVLSVDERAQISRMAEQVWCHKAAAYLLNQDGKAEQTVKWRDDATGLECKCRPDWMINSGQILVDLKTTEDASPAGFQRSLATYRYHVQAAHYMRGVRMGIAADPEQFIFICVEKKPPYAVAVYASTPLVISAGARVADRDLERLASCRASGVWPSYSDQIETIDLPKWIND